MFSGKSTTLLDGMKYVSPPFLLITPALDTRSVEGFKTHNGGTIKDVPVQHLRLRSEDCLGLASRVSSDVTHVFFDEVQFFPSTIVSEILQLVDRGIDVTAAGLDLDFRRRPFGPMPELLVHADLVIKLTARCAGCGSYKARMSHRLVASDATILIGAEELYEPLCTACYVIRTAKS
jgi:thymidine kinase